MSGIYKGTTGVAVRSGDTTMPTIACVIPTYNRGNLVVRAVESVLAQSVPVDEIIVVDDGSTDNTRELLYGKPLQFVTQANAGGAAARNAGIRLAASEWVAFLDSDDVWEREHIERIRAAIVKTSSRADLYFSNARLDLCGSTSILWDIARFQPRSPVEIVDDGVHWAFLPTQPMMLQACVVKRSAAMAVGGLDTELPRRHDTHFFFKMSMGRPVCAVAGVGATMSNDDPQGRLTGRWGFSSETYLQSTVHLYGDVLACLRQTSPYTGEVRRRLSSAHRQLSRLYGRRSAWFRSARETLRALRCSPVDTLHHSVSHVAKSVTARLRSTKQRLWQHGGRS